jgi:hypothetical protein
VKFAARLILSSFGAFAIGWTAGDVWLLGITRPTESMARSALSGQKFEKKSALEFASLPASSELTYRDHRASAIIYLYLAETAIADGNGTLIDRFVNEAKEQAVKALQISPSDGFLWISLCWVATVEQDSTAKFNDFLASSFAAAPSEGWIIQRRLPIALGAYSKLTESNRRSTIEDFSRLVQAALTTEAALILGNVNPQLRTELLVGVAPLETYPKYLLAKELRRQGLRFNVPGIEPDEDRPWN